MTAPVIRQFVGTIPDKGQAQTAFDTNVDAFLDWQALQFAPDLVEFGTFASDTAAALVAANLPSLTGRALDAVRVNAAANGVEFANVTAAGWALLDDANAKAQRVTLGLASATNSEQLRVVESVNDSIVAQFINSAGGFGGTQGKGYIGFGVSNSFEETGCYIGWDQESISGFQQALTFGTRPNSEVFPTERMRITSGGNVQIINSLSVKGATLDPVGTAPLFACRAWVNFNGTGTVAIRASGNVSSITDNGTGDYTINFATALPDANYCTVSGTTPAGGDQIPVGEKNGGTKTTSAVRVVVKQVAAGFTDGSSVSVAIFR